ncbi:alkyl sulfatase dimerization domain-containing protein [Streptomyces sp. CA-111067]|uniref:alkyl sulfatase dimerization domain-containing protein n=1 Tax=Streptomyces sp. CA-111067 TaxID=3240046 RepID=UPI003D994855
MIDLMGYADRVWTGQEDLRPYFSGALREDGLLPVADGVWMWAATGNVYVFRTAGGLLLFDTGDRHTSRALHTAVRAVTQDPLHIAVFSHGHVDHVLGMDPFDQEAAERGLPRPEVIAHRHVPRRFERYVLTAGYNSAVNGRQFRAPGLKWPTVYRQPDTLYDQQLDLREADTQVLLRHGMGETDDATMAWLPDRRILCCGDFYAWNAPNAGNPQKVQRFVAEWSQALHWMAGLGAELLLPGHGVPIAGAERIRQTLLSSAALLDHLQQSVLELMNGGLTLDEVLHRVRVPAEMLSKPYLRPTYDEPEFIVRNLWRRYGGWYDGDPAALRPAPRAELAAEVAELAGGPQALARRALLLAKDGDLRLAGHLAEFAALAAAPGSAEHAEAHQARAQVMESLAADSPSFMAKSIYGWAASQSQAASRGEEPGKEEAGWAP